MYLMCYFGFMSLIWWLYSKVQLHIRNDITYLTSCALTHLHVKQGFSTSLHGRLQLSLLRTLPGLDNYI